LDNTAPMKNSLTSSGVAPATFADTHPPWHQFIAQGVGGGVAQCIWMTRRPHKQTALRARLGSPDLPSNVVVAPQPAMQPASSIRPRWAILNRCNRRACYHNLLHRPSAPELAP
jgi:hypothetical protein